MTVTANDTQTGAVRDIEVDHDVLNASIAECTGPSATYYARAFQIIHDTTGLIPKTFNMAAALAGPFWAAARGA